MIKIHILSIGLLISQTLFGQASFELEYNKPGDEFLQYTFETSTGDFISIGAQSEYSYSVPRSQLILKLNSSGEIINEMIYTKPDTNFFFKYGYEKANGNYFLMGTLTDSLTSNDFNITYVCERTPELNLVWEKIYAIPEPYIHHNLDNFIMDADSMLIIQGSADSSFYGEDDVLITMEFDKYGNQLVLNLYNNWSSPNSSNAMIFNKDSTSIFFFGVFTTGLSVLKEFIEMDLDLNITDYISIIDWEHFSSPPITVKIMPNSNFLQASKSTIEPGAYHDLYIKIMDEEFNTLHDTLLLYPGYDYIPYSRGMGFIDQNQIWVPTFNPEFNSFSGTEVFRFHIFDSDLNLTAMKLYGGDRRYTFFNMIVTSDGGCLMTGSVCDYIGSYSDNGYIIKVLPEDIITHAEETPITIDRDVAIYPNPFSNELRFQTARKDLSFELFDVTGRKILSGNIQNNAETHIATGSIRAGIYFYMIQDGSRIVQSGKLINE